MFVHVIVVQCPYPTTDHSMKVFCPSNAPPIFGETCNFQCNEGYRASGDMSVTCDRNGKLIGSATCAGEEYLFIYILHKQNVLGGHIIN